MASNRKQFVPGSDDFSNEIFTDSCITDEETVQYLNDHGRIMFIIRGPPGTAKETLAEMLRNSYETANVYSADNYFQETFAGVRRDKESLKKSHTHCHRKVWNACFRNYHPIIVKNTHMCKREFQQYLNFAAEFNYVVILLTTIDKFKVSPNILANSNTKGLDEEYFKRRLKQWREVFPDQTGWFLSPLDLSFLMSQLQTTLGYLLSDGKFCSEVDAYDKVEVLKRYKPRGVCYCVATEQMKKPSEQVIKNFGSCFRITVHGYLITLQYILAIVHLDENLMALCCDDNTKYPIIKSPPNDNSCLSQSIGTTYQYGSDICSSMSALKLSRKPPSKENKTLGDSYSDEGKTEILMKWAEDEGIEAGKSSFIHLADSLKAPSEMSKAKVRKMLGSIAGKNGQISNGQLSELSDQFMFSRVLDDDAWFVKPPGKISLQSVFTGLYK